jgi:hypothetical protein
MNKKIESYQELKARQQKEVDGFEGIFFAFNNKQFSEGMEKIGLTENQKDKIYSLGGTGGFILKERSKALHEMLDRHSVELKQNRKDRKFLLEALTYELKNHEYCITHSVTEALDSLGLEIKDVDGEILKQACKMAA